MAAQLHCGDNLSLMGWMESESVDLIYADPPFMTGRKHKAGADTRAAGAEFDDRWREDDGVVPGAAIALVMDCARSAHGKAMAAYLKYMGVRLEQMRRLLSPNGTMWLHCNSAASFYLKVLADTIFGADNFLREVIWNHHMPCGGKSAGNRPTKVSETLFIYAAEIGKHTYNKLHLPYRDGYAEKWFFQRDADGRKYRTRKRGGEIIKEYLDESPGMPMPNVWGDIKPLNAGGWFPNTKEAKERTGYPTQKPIKLLERIIQISTNRGDVVLDPFMGSGTAGVAAEKLGRDFIGMDISRQAAAIAEKRIRNTTRQLL